MYERTDERTDGEEDGQTEGRTDGRTGRRTDGRTAGVALHALGNRRRDDNLINYGSRLFCVALLPERQKRPDWGAFGCGGPGGGGDPNEKRIENTAIVCGWLVICFCPVK